MGRIRLRGVGLATLGRSESLTGHLARASDPVRQFLFDVLPGEAAKPMNDAIRAQLAAGPKVLGAGLAPWEHGLIGTALDYRLRYWFDTPSKGPLVAAYGLATLNPQGTGVEAQLREAGEQFFDRLPGYLQKLKPAGRLLGPTDELDLDRCCIVLALLEQLWRVGLRPGSPLQLEPLPRTADDLLALARPTWLEDLGQIARLFHESATRENLPGRPTVLNPTFEGSSDVSGADADLIIDDCLIEIKATIQSKFRDPVLPQLLGYLLLDYPDEFHIESVGLYLARHGTLLRWPRASLLRGQSAAEVRTRLRALLNSPVTVHR